MNKATVRKNQNRLKPKLQHKSRIFFILLAISITGLSSLYCEPGSECTIQEPDGQQNNNTTPVQTNGTTAEDEDDITLIRPDVYVDNQLIAENTNPPLLQNTEINTSREGSARIMFGDMEISCSLNPSNNSTTRVIFRPFEHVLFRQLAGVTYVLWDSGKDEYIIAGEGDEEVLIESDDPALRIIITPQNEVTVAAYRGNAIISTPKFIPGKIIPVIEGHEVKVDIRNVNIISKTASFTQKEIEDFSGLYELQEKTPPDDVIDSRLNMYGGTLNVPTNIEPSITDSRGWPVYEQFMGPDWNRGAAVSGITKFASGTTALEDSMMPLLTESWEMSKPGIWIMQVRQRVHWQPTGTPAGKLMGAREMTADDIVSSFNWQLHEMDKSLIHVSQPAVAAATTIEKTGDWEITVRTPIDYLTSWTWVVQGAVYHRVYPYDVIKQFGHELIYGGEGWHYSEAVGTGPWMTEVVVPGTLRKFKKNPLYWQTDPVGPGQGNQLPYIDTYTELYLPDRSTALAAFRTGKVGYITALNRDDWESEMSLTPGIQWADYLQPAAFARFILMRTDKPPFDDVRVRQALMMATDFNAWKNAYYNGAAEIDIWPLNSNFTGSGYLPLDGMPVAVRELYTYNPDRARQLLAEAGYPDGFKTTILTPNRGTEVDEVAVFKDMWAKVGVDLAIDVREAAVVNGIQRDYDQMVYRTISTSWPTMYHFSPIRGPSITNLSYINDPPGSDPIIEEAFQTVNDNMIVNMPEVYRQMENLRPYLMEQAHVIPRPTPYDYTVWQPWLKNFYGFTDSQNFWKYHWIDQDLKESMGQ